MDEKKKKWTVKMKDPVSGEWKTICTTTDSEKIERIVTQLSEDGEECSLEEFKNVGE